VDSKAMPAIAGNNLINFMAGGLSGLIGQFISYPFDVVKKKMMVQGNFQEN
jgi:hypothetical protein